MEKHPFNTQQGVVIAIAPLAGLSVSPNPGTYCFMLPHVLLLRYISFMGAN